MGIDLDKVRGDWAARGFTCGLWVDPPGRVWADFIHDTDELVMVVEGKQEFEIDGKAVRPEVGEEVLIPAHTRHTARNVGSVQSKWLYGYRR